MRGALAEYERAKILERSRRGKIGRAKAGHPSGGRVPLGYRAVYQSHAGHWEVEPEEAALVERIFAMCLSGMPTRAIARQLTEERLPTRCDRHPEEGGNKRQARGVWSPQSVHQILTYQGYTGVAYRGKRTRVSKTTRRRESPGEWIQILIPLIIDEATFQAAPRQLQRNRALAVRNRKHEYLLVGGRFRCGRCGRAMTGLPGTGVLYYRCGASYQVPDLALRCRGSIRADEAEQRVWSAVERVLQRPDLIAAEVARQHATADERRADIAHETALVNELLTNHTLI
jgi:site-specific DNA recombinase